jgi:hypothetical protein
VNWRPFAFRFGTGGGLRLAGTAVGIDAGGD